MGSAAVFMLAAWMAIDPSKTEAGDWAGVSPGEEAGQTAEAPKGGAGVSPVELIPRLELRQSFNQVSAGTSFHDTTAEIDIQFLDRVLLRYQGAVRVLSTPAGQVSGFGDIELQAIAIVASAPRYVVAVIPGAILNTASQAPLGAGKQQVLFGAAAAVKPVRWWLPYLVIQEQLSVGGESARPDINQLTADVGSILFGKGYSWTKIDLFPVADFQGSTARLFGTLEVGRLLIGRVGMFTRANTQLAGPHQIDYALEVGVRYLFHLELGR
jgi:hypothetical protein